MRLAASNIALPSFDHQKYLPKLVELGFVGLEVAPSKVWADTWRGLTAADIATYRRQVEAAGLHIIGLHSLFFDHKNLGLFKDPGTREKTLDFMEHLSILCRDLGGKTLIYGGGRNRGSWTRENAQTEAISFMSELCQRIENHGTCFCFEPLGPNDTDFIHSALDSLEIVNAVNHPALKIQLDAKALLENDEVTPTLFQAVSGQLIHFHANEPGLNILGSSGEVDHAAMGRLLKDVGYTGYVSLEQRMIDETRPLVAMTESAAILKQHYDG
jgi:sugar phosphate isomerase/epimerase